MNSREEKWISSVVFTHIQHCCEDSLLIHANLRHRCSLASENLLLIDNAKRALLILPLNIERNRLTRKIYGFITAASSDIRAWLKSGFCAAATRRRVVAFVEVAAKNKRKHSAGILSVFDHSINSCISVWWTYCFSSPRYLLSHCCVWTQLYVTYGTFSDLLFSNKIFSSKFVVTSFMFMLGAEWRMEFVCL